MPPTSSRRANASLTRSPTAAQKNVPTSLRPCRQHRRQLTRSLPRHPDLSALSRIHASPSRPPVGTKKLLHFSSDLARLVDLRTSRLFYSDAPSGRRHYHRRATSPSRATRRHPRAHSVGTPPRCSVIPASRSQRHHEPAGAARFFRTGPVHHTTVIVPTNRSADPAHKSTSPAPPVSTACLHLRHCSGSWS